MSYYYFMASLPTLSLERRPPCSEKEFLDQVSALLGERCAEDIRALLDGHFAAIRSPEARTWQATERQMRNELTRLRADRLGVDATPYLEECGVMDLPLLSTIQRAFSQPDPLSMEKALDACRWSLLEEMATRCPFGPGALMAYALQLQIVTRWHKMKASEGRDHLNETVHRYTQQAEAAGVP